MLYWHGKLFELNKCNKFTFSPSKMQRNICPMFCFVTSLLFYMIRSILYETNIHAPYTLRCYRKLLEYWTASCTMEGAVFLLIDRHCHLWLSCLVSVTTLFSNYSSLAKTFFFWYLQDSESQGQSQGHYFIYSCLYFMSAQ